MRQACIAVLVLFFLVLPVQAINVQDELTKEFGVDSIEDGLQPDAKQLMEDVSITEQGKLLESIGKVLSNSIDQFGNVFRKTMKLMLKMLLIIILCKLSEVITDGGSGAVSTLAGALAMMSYCVSDLTAMVGLGKETIREMKSFTDLLLPVMTSLSCASGAVSSSGGIHTVTVLFSGILMRLCDGLLVPGAYTCAGLAVADCVLGESRLKKIRELLKWGLELFLKGIAYGFSALVSITGILSGGTDTASVKGVQSVISAAVPIVGGIISGAADTVMHGAALLRNSVGAFGLLGILAICILPFLHLAVSWLLFRVIAAIGGILDSKLSGLLEALSSIMGLLLGMVGTCAWIVMLACCCYVRVAQR